MEDINDLSDLCPMEMSRLLDRMPRNASNVRIKKGYVKDIGGAQLPIAPHPRYAASTFIDVEVQTS